MRHGKWEEEARRQMSKNLLSGTHRTGGYVFPNLSLDGPPSEAVI